MDYKEQLKSPKWQKKRLEIMERDAFQCQCCLEKDKTLVVHHITYVSGLMAWEYDNDLLITICEGCHESVHYHIEKKMYDNEILYTFFKCNPIYIDIYKRRLIEFVSEKGSVLGIKELIRLLMSQTINKDQI
jgi:hypothetical protein